MQNPVLIFDSGVGARAMDMALKARNPRLRTVVVEDTEGFPYGDKPEKWTEGRVCRLVEAAVEQHAPSSVVLACNTASFCAGAALQARLKLPLYLTFPPLADAVRLTASRHIAVFVTPATGRHDAFLRRMEQLRQGGVHVTLVADSALAEMAQDYIASRAVPDLKALETILRPIANAARIDVCVLGCTHYGFLRGLIERAVGREIAYLDSAECVAQRIVTDLSVANQRTA